MTDDYRFAQLAGRSALVTAHFTNRFLRLKRPQQGDLHDLGYQADRATWRRRLLHAGRTL